MYTADEVLPRGQWESWRMLWKLTDVQSETVKKVL